MLCKDVEYDIALERRSSDVLKDSNVVVISQGEMARVLEVESFVDKVLKPTCGHGLPMSTLTFLVWPVTEK